MGVPAAWAEESPARDAFEWAQSSGLLESFDLDGEPRLRLSTRGRLLSNEVFVRLV
jgi:hypothetical protein